MCLTRMPAPVGLAVLSILALACGSREEGATARPEATSDITTAEVSVSAPPSTSTASSQASAVSSTEPVAGPPEPPAPPGELTCRAHDGATTYELYVSLADRGFGTGVLRKRTESGVTDQALAVQSYKGSFLLDAPGSKNIVQTRGRMLQGERQLQVGADWNTPWFDCDPEARRR